MYFDIKYNHQLKTIMHGSANILTPLMHLHCKSKYYLLQIKQKQMLGLLELICTLTSIQNV